MFEISYGFVMHSSFIYSNAIPIFKTSSVQDSVFRLIEMLVEYTMPTDTVETLKRNKNDARPNHHRTFELIYYFYLLYIYSQRDTDRKVEEFIDSDEFIWMKIQPRSKRQIEIYILHISNHSLHSGGRLAPLSQLYT